jgi:hypothetical protein
MKKTRVEVLLLGALVWILPAQLRPDTATAQKSSSTAKTKSQSTPPHRTQKALAGTVQHRSTHPTAKRRVSSKARRAAAARRRRALMRPQPERIQEIQQALVQAGYLKEESDGRWDDQTREAMRRYQADHGFPTTGLPEAKSLMKLGLGPHPLPGDVDTSSGSRPGGDALSNPPAPSSTQQNPP